MALKPLFRTLRARAFKKGQTFVEYTLILAVLTIVAVSVFGLFSQRLIIVFSSITNILDTAQSSH